MASDIFYAIAICFQSLRSHSITGSHWPHLSALHGLVIIQFSHMLIKQLKWKLHICTRYLFPCWMKLYVFMYIDGICLSFELVIFVSLYVTLWVKHAPLSCILVRKEVKDTLIFSAFAFNFVTFFRSSDGIIFLPFSHFLQGLVALKLFKP